MSIEDDIEFFERVPTLALLGREALRILAIGAESRYLEDGDVLCHQGDPVDSQSVFTATARQASTVIRIPRGLFVKMLEGYPEAAARLRDSLLALTEQTARDMRSMRGRLGGNPDKADAD